MNTKPDGKEKHVKKPIRRSMLAMMLSMFAVLCVLIFILSYVFFSKALYTQYDSKLTGVVTYIENNIDADDLKTCIETGKHTEKYDEAQLFLNKIIDDLGLKYIYIVIPKDTVMVNVISATSAEEFAAGDDNMPLLEEGDWYTPEELAKYKSYWNEDEICFFEETDAYDGITESHYVGCKPLRDSSGETVALICVDLLSSQLRATVMGMVVVSIAIVVVVFIAFGLILGLWLYRNVTKPLRTLESGAYKFASVKSDTGELEYTAPDIRSSNEVGSLAEAIKKMTSDIKNYIKEREEAEIKIHVAEEENIRLAEKAEAAAKISELSQSVYDLLNNLPALTFYKDTAGGKYLGCNQAFAAYAGKASPADVIGLTDYDMFAEKDADHFVEVDKIVMGLDHPYVILETAPDSDGVVRTFQTTKLKFKDASGEERLLGLCMDLTEMASAKRETEQALEAYEAAMSSSLTYSGIARALSTNYTYIYYVNIESEEFIEYRNELSKESITEEKRGSGFFAQSVKDAESLLYKDDRKEFLSVFNKDNLIKKIDTTGAFTYTYRLMIEGVPTYMNLKATRIKDDPEHIVIGVYNVDAEMKDKEAIERYKEERITFARIAALSSDFICIYTVDPETDCYSEYMATSEYEGLGLAKEGDRFFDAPYRDNASSIWYEDREMFLSMVTKENVLKEIKEHGLFVLNYRIVVNEEPLYVALKAAIVEERDGPQLIVGVSNIDAQVKREKEYDYNLSMARNQANIDALTGVKNKHAYLDAEAKLNGQIEDGSIKEFALVVFDVNELKLANDTYGHRVGDELLREACMIICHQFKHSPVYRIGGDEFAVIAKGQDYENIDELVSGIDEINLKSRAEKGAVVACGMAKYKNEQNVAELFEKADVAMYENKRKLKQ